MRDKITIDENVSMGIPRIYWKEYLDEIQPLNEEQNEYIDKLTKLLHGGFWSLCVLGTVGNGKTRLACALCSLYEYSHPYTVKYTTQEALVDECKASFSDDGRSELDVVRRYSTCRLLVLDELTQRGWTDYAKNVVQRILSFRHAQRLRTVVIGNLDVQTFKTMFDDHILSRFREGRTQLMTAPDMRLNGGF